MSNLLSRLGRVRRAQPAKEPYVEESVEFTRQNIRYARWRHNMEMFFEEVLTWTRAVVIGTLVICGIVGYVLYSISPRI